MEGEKGRTTEYVSRIGRSTRAAFDDFPTNICAPDSGGLCGSRAITRRRGSEETDNQRPTLALISCGGKASDVDDTFVVTLIRVSARHQCTEQHTSTRRTAVRV